MRVRDGVANIDYIRGVLHQGQLDTRVSLNARRPVVEAEVEGGLKGVNIGLLLASLGNHDAASGRIEMSWDVESKGVTAEDLVGGLDGDIKAAGQDLLLEKVSVQGLVCNAVAVVNKIPPIAGLPTTTPITDLSLGMTSTRGREIERLRFATPGIVMKGSGDVDRAQWTSVSHGRTSQQRHHAGQPTMCYRSTLRRRRLAGRLCGQLVV